MVTRPAVITHNSFSVYRTRHLPRLADQRPAKNCWLESVKKFRTCTSGAPAIRRSAGSSDTSASTPPSSRTMAVLTSVPHRYACQEILARTRAAGLPSRGAPGGDAAHALVTAGNLAGGGKLQAHRYAPVERVAIEVPVCAARLGLAVCLDEDALGGDSGRHQHRRDTLGAAQRQLA